MLAGDGEHAGVELAHLLASAGVLSRERPRERTRATADVQHAARPGGVQDEPQPADVVELEVGDVRKVDVGGVHAGLAQQPSRRTSRIRLDDQLSAPDDRARAPLPVGHADRLTDRSREYDPQPMPRGR